ncbi:hypothetical protein CYMTET_21811, partial [Cymbomonas tetramitiformis]
MPGPFHWLQKQIVRPPRLKYDPERHLPGPFLNLNGKEYFRNDISPLSRHGRRIECSHYLPTVQPRNAMPCVIYCHTNSGGRPEANEIVLTLLPNEISVFVLDFVGSGLS